jgi:hypothetical protein
MGNFAAVLVLIACPAGGTGCINEPVRVISYDSAFTCKAQREEEIRKVHVAGFKIYGECNSINGELLAGKPRINIKRDVEKIGTKKRDNEALFPAPRRAFIE